MSALRSMPIRLVLILMGLLAGWWWAQTREAPAAAAAADPSTVAPVRGPAPGAIEAMPKALSVPPPAMPATPSSAPLSTYSLIVQLQADSRPVERAQARELIQGCRNAVSRLLAVHRKHRNDIEFWDAIHSRTPLPQWPEETEEGYERRRLARDLILSHCSEALHDEQAQQHPSVTEQHHTWRLGFKEGLRRQLQTQDFRLAMLTVLTARTTQIAYFEGLPWGGVSPEGYTRALYFAMAMDSRQSTQTSIQLDMAGECVEAGHCAADAESQEFFQTVPNPETQAQAHALAPRIFAAMKAGRVEAFLPPAGVQQKSP